ARFIQLLCPLLPPAALRQVLCMTVTTRCAWVTCRCSSLVARCRIRGRFATHLLAGWRRVTPWVTRWTLPRSHRLTDVMLQQPIATAPQAWRGLGEDRDRG